MPRTQGSGASRGGGDDFHNEDAFLVDEGLGLYVVCDGASSRPAGERASEIAINALEELVAESTTDLGPLLLRSEESRALVAGALAHAIECVVEAAHDDPALEGMATTVTLLLAHEDRGVIGHLGDSRAVLLREGRLHRLTVDHELTAELTTPAPTGRADEIDTFEIDLHADDVLILHTDGAEQALTELNLSRASTASPALLASRIVSAAHRLHPELDATVVVVRVLPDSHRAWLALSEEPRNYGFGHRIAIG